MNIILKSVGVNKVKVIKIVREVTGLGLKEAKEIVDSVENGTEYTITNIPQERVQPIINEFTKEGAFVVEESNWISDFDAAIDESISNSVSDTVDLQEARNTESAKDTKEFASDVDEKTTYQPKVSPEKVSQLDRQATMDVLIEVGKIAKEVEGYAAEIADLSTKIDSGQKEAEKLRKQLSGKALAIIWGATIVAAIVGMMGESIFGAVILGGLAYFIARAIVTPRDLSEHEAENNANADDYIRQNVEPLQKRLEEVYALRKKLNDSGKITWAVDVIGRDMFYSACISDLYNLIKSRRADSLKEALNKYDDEQHKAHMEEMQRAIQNASEVTAAESVKQTAYSADMAKSARQTATASKATAYHTRQTARNTRRFR